MCGIAGIAFNYSSEQLDYLKFMLEALNKRGPDDSGIWIKPEEGIALGHTRLSILDLSAAAYQPMHSHSARYVITFNGEIYNFKALKEELIAHGYSFKSTSDTEVLLTGIEHWGIDETLNKCQGMFAFALWDRQEKKLTLARDRFGEKPIYYSWVNGVLLFASELKAIFKYPLHKRQIDRNVLAEFMRYSYIPAPYSIYEGVYKIDPGTYLEIQAEAKVTHKQYWSAQKTAHAGMLAQQTSTLDDKTALNMLASHLNTVIKNQCVADVPLGVLLSGGIDSSLVAAMIQQQSSKSVKSFSIGFNVAAYNEADYAKKVAQHLGTEHTELYVTDNSICSVIAQLPYIYDEPFADSSQIPTYLVSQFARSSVKVALTGDGADELFGGYNRYIFAENIFNKAVRWPESVRKFLANKITAVSPCAWNKFYQYISDWLPKKYQVNLFGDKFYKLADIVKAADTRSSFYNALISIIKNPNELVVGAQPITSFDTQLIQDKDFVQSMMLADTLMYLPGDILTKVDRASMAVSLETRAPFLDHGLFEFAWQLPLHFKIRDNQTKWILRQLLYRYVPKELITRPKMGFGVPLADWLRGVLRAWAEELLAPEKIQRQGYLNPVYVTQMWHEHLTRKRNWMSQLWNILMFQAWLEVHE